MSEDCYKRCRQYDLCPQFKSPSQNFAIRTIKKVWNGGLTILKKIFSSEDERKPHLYDWDQVQRVMQIQKRGFVPKSIWEVDCINKQKHLKAEEKKPKLTIFQIKEKLQMKKKLKPVNITFRVSSLKDLQRSLLTSIQNYRRQRHIQQIENIKLNINPVPMEDKYIGVSLFQFYRQKKHIQTNKKIQSKPVFNLDSQMFRKQVNNEEKDHRDIFIEKNQTRSTLQNVQSNNSSLLAQFSEENQEDRQCKQKNIKNPNQETSQLTQISKNIIINSKEVQTEPGLLKKTLFQKQINKNSEQRQFQKTNDIVQAEKKQRQKSLNFEISNNNKEQINSAPTENKGKINNPFLEKFSNHDQKLQKMRQRVFNLSPNTMLSSGNNNQNIFVNSNPFMSKNSNNNSSMQKMFSLAQNSQNIQEKSSQDLYKNGDTKNMFNNQPKKSEELKSMPLNMFPMVNSNNKASNPLVSNKSQIQNQQFSMFSNHNGNNGNITSNNMSSNQFNSHQNNNNSLTFNQNNLFGVSDRQNSNYNQLLNSFFKKNDKSGSQKSIFGEPNESFNPQKRSERTVSKKKIKDKHERI